MAKQGKNNAFSRVLTIDSLSTADATINKWICTVFLFISLKIRVEKYNWKVKTKNNNNGKHRTIQTKDMNETSVAKKKAHIFLLSEIDTKL